MGQQDGVAIAALVLLVFSVLLGGASRQHELRLALVELSALPLLVLAGLRLLKQDDLSHHKFAFWLVAGTVALPLLQLIPLPPGIWTALPGRDQSALALDVIGLAPGWLPLSLTPDKTWNAFLALLPPVAMFLGVLAVRPAGTGRLNQALLGFIIASIMLGAAQVASGGDSLYPWATTSPGNVTGFFANRNHLATLCLIGLPFAVVLAAGGLHRQTSNAQLSLWLGVLYIALTVIALGVIRSRIGIILFGPILGASLLAAWVAVGRGRPKPALLALAGGAGLAIAAVGAFALAPLVARFDTQGAREGRFENWPIVAEAADAHLPVGAGLGSFDTVFRSVEPLDRLDFTYFNQAHNDYLELWLETGWLGAALLAAFLIWFGRRAWSAWRARAGRAYDLQRAATIGIAAILLHSAGDYPLRTVTLATILALCCGLLELAQRGDAERSPARTRRRVYT